MASTFDAPVKRFGQEIAVRTHAWSLEYETGKLNVSVASGPDGFNVSCNFHKGSKDHGELEDWLATPMDRVKSTVAELMAALNLDIEEEEDGIDEE